MPDDIDRLIAQHAYETSMAKVALASGLVVLILLGWAVLSMFQSL